MLLHKLTILINQLFRDSHYETLDFDQHSLPWLQHNTGAINLWQASNIWDFDYSEEVSYANKTSIILFTLPITEI